MDLKRAREEVARHTMQAIAASAKLTVRDSYMLDIHFVVVVVVTVVM